MKRTSYGAPLVGGHRKKMDWKQWEKDFLSGRTHVLYGMIIAFVMSLYMMSVFYGRDLSGFIVALVLAFTILASATDLVSHLYWH